MKLLSSRLTDSDVLLDGLCINLGQEHCYFIDRSFRKYGYPINLIQREVGDIWMENLLTLGRDHHMMELGME